MVSNSGSSWNIDRIVGQLRDIRVRSLESRLRENRPPKLPSRKMLATVIEGLGTALFPNRLGTGDLSKDGIDYFVGNTIDAALTTLVEQVRRELQFKAETEGNFANDVSAVAFDVVREFGECLPSIRELLDTDLAAAFEGDPAASSIDEVLVCYPGVQAITHHRIAHRLYALGAPLVARIITELAHSSTGIDIHPGAKIGASFFIDHGTGIVVGETAVIGQNVRLYQMVTLGAKRFPTDDNGVLVKGQDRHPIVEDNVVIYAGATILGRITIGHGSIIGGNVWLTQSVPPGSVITNAQGRSESVGNGASI